MSMFSKLTGHDAKLRGRQIAEQQRTTRGSAARHRRCTIALSVTRDAEMDGRPRSTRPRDRCSLARCRRSATESPDDPRGWHPPRHLDRRPRHVVRGRRHEQLGEEPRQRLRRHRHERIRELPQPLPRSDHRQIDRDDSNRNADKNRRAALWGAGINAVGQAAGAVRAGK
jgi:hypothetical protein